MSYNESVLVGSIQRFSTEDGPGIRTTVFIKGCPLKCKWCHNPEMIGPEQILMRREKNCIACNACIDICPTKAISIRDNLFHIDRDLCNRCMKCVDNCYAEALSTVGNPMTVDEIMHEVCKDEMFYNETGGGVTLSGGEILTKPEFAHEMIAACHEKGYKVALDTTGFCKYEIFLPLAQECDLILYDMKGIDDQVHQQYTGVSNQLILDNLTKLAAIPEINAKIMIRMPLIKDVNDTVAIIDKTCEFLTRNHLKEAFIFPYHELGLSKYRGIGQKFETFQAPEKDRLYAIYHQFMDSGIHTNILGENIA